MRIALLSLALVFGATAFANDELDQERTVAQPAAPTADQIAKAKHLPQTTVIRVSKADPSKVEVVFLKDKVAAGQKLTGLQFEQMALQGEKTGIAYTAANELDAVSSTSSWSFGYGRGAYGRSAGYVNTRYGSAGYIRGPRGGVGYVNGRYGSAVGGYHNGGGSYYGGSRGYYSSGSAYYGGNNCYTPRCYDSCYDNVCDQAYYPTYQYAGYQYNYRPYYGWNDDQYDYAYCDWVY